MPAMQRHRWRASAVALDECVEEVCVKGIGDAETKSANFTNVLASPACDMSIKFSLGHRLGSLHGIMGTTTQGRAAVFGKNTTALHDARR
jgi:hypothetical protein